MKIERAFVVDLGTDRLVALAATLTEKGGLLVEGVAEVHCQGVAKGAVEDPEPVADAIDEAMSEVERQAGDSAKEIAMTIGGPTLQSVASQGFVPIYPPTRAVRRDDVLQVIGHSRQLMMPAGREQISALPREFSIDGKRGLLQPVGMTGGRLEVFSHIVTGQTAQVQNTDRAVTMAGRAVRQMVPQPIASAIGVATDQEADSGCIVLDIGGAWTNVTLFENGSVSFVACVPVGGRHVTSDIKALIKTSSADAEALKLASGCAKASIVPEEDAVHVAQEGSSEPRPMQRRVLCEIVESRMKEIFSLAWRQIETTGTEECPRGGVVMTGGGSLLEGCDVLAAEVFGTRKARTAVPKVMGPHRKTVEAAGMAAAVGAARYCLEGEELEFAPVSGFSNWKDRIRTLRSLFGTKG